MNCGLEGDLRFADVFDSGNRFDAVNNELRFEGITELHLDETLLSWDEVCRETC